MNIEEIKTLTDLMVQNDLAEIIIRDGEKRILIRRKGAQFEHAACGLPSYSVPGMAPSVAHAPAAPAPAAVPVPAAPTAPTGLPIKSPMVGTFYSASDPESPPFARIGDRINPDSVVCIIEAMKVFNEIKAEVSGILESIEVQNGAPVEFGQVLMRVRPG